MSTAGAQAMKNSVKEGVEELQTLQWQLVFTMEKYWEKNSRRSQVVIIFFSSPNFMERGSVFSDY